MQQPTILGIDEVGRGPWAGPLVVGAVVLGKKFRNADDEQLNFLYNSLADSKKLTAIKRKKLSPLILELAAATGIGWVTSTELDQYGLSAALKLATRRAVKQVLAQKVPFTEIIIDGTVNFLQHTPLEDRVTTLPKADSLIKEVSAASIIAKVARDSYMAALEDKYPGYSFAKHVGYGTAAHKAALAQLGPCPEHRRSFRPIAALCNQIVAHPHQKQSQAQAPGAQAELAVINLLQAQGHHIIAHNYKTKTYEIDIISTTKENLYFTEVKYSQNLRTEGTPLVRITSAKQNQMHYAADAFINSHQGYQHLSPALAVAAVTGNDYQVSDWLILR